MMKHIVCTLALVSMGLVDTACNASRISGTYVAHMAAFAEMLQLTQTENGHFTGVLTFVELKQDGIISSRQTSLNRTEDGGQLTLNFSPPIVHFGHFEFGILGRSRTRR